jgi:hypothetical protein
VPVLSRAVRAKGAIGPVQLSDAVPVFTAVGWPGACSVAFTGTRPLKSQSPAPRGRTAEYGTTDEHPESLRSSGFSHTPPSGHRPPSTGAPAGALPRWRSRAYAATPRVVHAPAAPGLVSKLDAGAHGCDVPGSARAVRVEVASMSARQRRVFGPTLSGAGKCPARTHRLSVGALTRISASTRPQSIWN